MGVTPLRYLHKHCTGKNEIIFLDCNSLQSADDVITFKFVARTAATRNGLHATFSPKPIMGKDGSSFNIKISPVTRDGESCVDQFLAGIMAHIREMTVFCNPSESSYERLGSFKSMRYVAWTHKSRQQMVRKQTEADGTVWIELRSPDSTANPYLIYTLLLYAGLDGVKRGLQPAAPFDNGLQGMDENELKSLEQLPEHFDEAMQLAQESPFIRAHFPERLLEAYGKRNVDLDQ